MNFLIESMPKQIDKKIFTKDLQELIISLAYLYDIDAQKMQAIIKTCITPSGTVSRDELRKVARNHYQFDHSGLLPTNKKDKVDVSIWDINDSYFLNGYRIKKGKLNYTVYVMYLNVA